MIVRCMMKPIPDNASTPQVAGWRLGDGTAHIKAPRTELETSKARQAEAADQSQPVASRTGMPSLPKDGSAQLSLGIVTYRGTKEY